jgi:aspartate kinase
LEAIRPRVPDPRSSSPAVTPGLTNGNGVNPLTQQIFSKAAAVVTTAATNGNDNEGRGMASGSSTPHSLSRSMASLSGSLSNLRLMDEVAPQFNATVDQIKADHLKAARDVIKDSEILQELEDDLDYDCERLRSFLLAAQVRRISTFYDNDNDTILTFSISLDYRRNLH